MDMVVTWEPVVHSINSYSECTQMSICVITHCLWGWDIFHSYLLFVQPRKLLASLNQKYQWCYGVFLRVLFTLQPLELGLVHCCSWRQWKPHPHIWNNTLVWIEVPSLWSPWSLVHSLSFDAIFFVYFSFRFYRFLSAYGLDLFELEDLQSAPSPPLVAASSGFILE